MNPFIEHGYLAKELLVDPHDFNVQHIVILCDEYESAANLTN